MTHTELFKAPRVAARNDVPPGRAAVAAVRPGAASNQDAWAGVKTLLEIGFAVVRVVELAILFA
jgi:hypothetical protein